MGGKCQLNQMLFKKKKKKVQILLGWDISCQDSTQAEQTFTAELHSSENKVFDGNARNPLPTAAFEDFEGAITSSYVNDPSSTAACDILPLWIVLYSKVKGKWIAPL